MTNAKIAVLEWVCGGGTRGEQINSAEAEMAWRGLRAEGWAMLRCIAMELAKAGYSVSAAVDDQAVEKNAVRQLNGIRIVVSGDRDLQRPVPPAWEMLVRECDYALVIAPESAGILEQVVAELDGQRATLINCRGEFLRQSADKLATSRACISAGVLHPPTQLLHQTTGAWLDRVQSDLASEQWVIKPTRGAGAEALQIVGRAELNRWLSESSGTGQPDNENNQLIVQPWIAGSAFSRSAIVSREGRWQWLPLVTQAYQLTASPLCSDVGINGSAWNYQGGTIADPCCLVPPPKSLFERIPAAFAAGAAGWVGIDLVCSERDKQWYVIEVNPRFTTSVVGLAKSYQHNLLSVLLQSQISGFQELQGSWRSVEFTASGQVVGRD